MAWRSLSMSGKFVILAGSTASVGALGYFFLYPYHREPYMTLRNIAETDKTLQRKIVAAWEDLQQSESNSLLKKHLTKDILERLKGRKTGLDASLYDVIRSGVANPDASVGVYAPDSESYTLFKELFDPIINEYHGFGPKQKQPPVDLGEGKIGQFEDLDPDGKYIISTRIRCGRKILGYPFNPMLHKEDYEIMERRVRESLEGITDDKELKGIYYPLRGMTEATQKQLINDHFLFKDNDRHLRAANALKYWPVGRGIFHNDAKTFLVWVNEEDHIRVISMQKGGDVASVLDRLIRGLKELEKTVKFHRDDRLGWLTFCPTNLGSTIRASVHAKLPKVSARSDFKELCDSLNLQVRGMHGEHSESGPENILDISNKARLGLTEFEAVKQMYDGVQKLIEMEKEQK